jgi:hypothetical protein
MRTLAILLGVSLACAAQTEPDLDAGRKVFQAHCTGCSTLRRARRRPAFILACLNIPNNGKQLAAVAVAAGHALFVFGE